MLETLPEGTQLTLSVGTFVNSQMCDGLAELATDQEARVSAIPVESVQHALELISQVSTAMSKVALLYPPQSPLPGMDESSPR